MSDDGPLEGRTGTAISHRSRKDLKAALMRAAFDGQSAYSPAEMILLIQWRLGASHIPPAHADMVAEMRKGADDEETPRSVMMLNAISRQLENGYAEQGALPAFRRRYGYTPKAPE